MITSNGRHFDVKALNTRGHVLVKAIGDKLSTVAALEELTVSEDIITGLVTHTEVGCRCF